VPETASTTDDQRNTHERLDDEHQIDHERILQIARYVEGLDAQLRDHAAHLKQASDKNEQPTARVSPPVDQLQRLIEQVARIDQLLNEHVTSQARATQAENLQRERERRQMTELTHQVESIARTVEASAGRVNALVEELRRERDARAPLSFGVEEAQRSLAALNSRQTAADEQARRLGANQATVEASLDRMKSDVLRIDNASKVLDLRLGRELAEIGRIVATSREEAIEQLKPVSGLVKQVAALTSQWESVEERLVQFGVDLESQRDEAVRLETSVRTERSAFNRVAEAAEAQARRAEHSDAAIWQLTERLDGLFDQLSRLERDTQTVSQQVEEVSKRVGVVDSERVQLAESFRGFTENARGEFLARRTQSNDIEHHLVGQIQSLADRLRDHERRSNEHLRRLLDELSRQLGEVGPPAPGSVA